MSSIEKEVDSYFDFILQQTDRVKDMRENYTYLVEYKNAISNAAVLLNKAHIPRNRPSVEPLFRRDSPDKKGGFERFEDEPDKPEKN